MPRGLIDGGPLSELLATVSSLPPCCSVGLNLDPPIESAVIVLVGLCSWCWVGAWVIGRSVRIFHVVVGLGRLWADGWAARRGWAVADSPA